MVTGIYQEVELSLTENLIPVTVPVKQYDNKERKVRCVLYNNSVEYTVPQNCIVALFRYPVRTVRSSTTRAKLRQTLYSLRRGAVLFTITTFMTAQAGRFPLDVVMLSTEGDVLGSFSLTLKVERAAINNGKIATYTFAAFLKAVRDGIRNLFIDKAGCFGFESDDGLGLSDRSESSSVEKLCREIVEGSITEDGYFCI